MRCRAAPPGRWAGMKPSTCSTSHGLLPPQILNRHVRETDTGSPWRYDEKIFDQFAMCETLVEFVIQLFDQP